jgi:hypothetical protein
MQREKKTTIELEEKKSDEEKKPLKTYENKLVSLNEYALFLHIGYEVVMIIYKQ